MKRLTTTLACAALLAAAACSTQQSGNFPEGLPSALRHAPIDGPLPEIVYASDTSIVTIQFLGDKPEPGTQMNVTVASVATFDELSPINLDESGKVTLTLPIQGTSNLQLALDDFTSRLGTVWVAPGEDTEIYIDFRPDSLKDSKRILYTTGKYAELNGMVSQYNDFYRYSISPFTSKYTYKMTGDEMVKGLTKDYADSLAALEADTIPEMLKAITRANLKASLPTMLEMKDMIVRASYMSTHPENPEVNPDSVVLSFTEDNVRELLKVDNLNDERIIMAHIMPLSMVLKNIDWSLGGTDDNLIAELSKFQALAAKASAGETTDADRQELSKMSNPEFYNSVIGSLNSIFESKKEKARKMIKTLPQGTPTDKVIETIAEPYRGKVVIIDMWNTWCSPCRAAIAENEPYKDSTLNNDDLIFVYIADESSPMPLYLSLIPEIKGEHYRLERDYAKALYERFSVDGIPFYILVDRNGNIEARPDFRDHQLYIKTVLEKLNQ